MTHEELDRAFETARCLCYARKGLPVPPRSTKSVLDYPVWRTENRDFPRHEPRSERYEPLSYRQMKEGF